MKRKLFGSILFVIALFIMLHLNLSTCNNQSKILPVLNKEALAEDEHSSQIDIEIKPGELYVGYTKQFQKVELNIGGKITFEMRPFCVKTFGLSITCTF